MSPPGRLDETAFRRKLRRVPVRVLRRALTLYAILTDRHAPPWARALVLAALVYLINPLDAIPDALPGLGLADDLAVLALALERLARFVTPRVEARAKRLAPRCLNDVPDNEDKGEQPEPATGERSHTQKGDPDHEPEKEDNDGRARRVPCIERFRIIP